MNNIKLGVFLTQTLNKPSKKQFQENLKNNKNIDKTHKERLVDDKTEKIIFDELSKYTKWLSDYGIDSIEHLLKEYNKLKR